MRRMIWMVGVAVLWPSLAVGGSCLEFPWMYPRDMIMPQLIQEGQQAMEEKSFVEARELFTTYLLDHDEGVFAEGATWVVASLPAINEDPEKDFLNPIKRLQTLKAEQADHVYVPWALCVMGQLYWDAGWHSEANALFEEFLDSYPEHPLAGRIMVEAGLGYLKNQQYLEAALILRRVVEEPRWEDHRIHGALGLADVTAMSKVWKQAYYWYRVVEAEKPELIRKSKHSSYYYGLTEVEVGDSRKVISRFLTTVNLYPHQKIAGKALNRISEQLLDDGHEFLSLWFADQAHLRFGGQESGRRGHAAQIRWVVAFLSHDHSKEEWSHVYTRFSDLEIYLSVSWDNVLEMARRLSHAPEQDLLEESLIWMGQGHLFLDDIDAAVQSFQSVVKMAISETGRQEAQRHLSGILNQHIQDFSDRHDWVGLLKFHKDQQEAFQLVPLTREHALIVAQAYQQINLPAKAMQWYEQLLKDHPESILREEIFAKKVFLAETQGQGDAIRAAGDRYVQEFPKGPWRAKVSTALGREALSREDYAQAIQDFSDVLTYTEEKVVHRYVLRYRALAYQKDWKRGLALRDLRQVVVLDPSDIANVVRLADFFFDQGDFSEAELLYEHVQSSEAPEALKVWATYRWGMTFEYQGKPLDAQKLLEEVRELTTEAPEFENTIRTAAAAVLDEFSLREMSNVGNIHEGS